MKAYNITHKAQQRSLLLDSIVESTLDIFGQLVDMGTDLDGAINALLNKFKESPNRLFNIHKFRCIKQGKDETWDSFISKLTAEGENCDFPVGWLDTEILMAMIENGKSKRVRRKLLQDQLTLAEALKYARGLRQRPKLRKQTVKRQMMLPSSKRSIKPQRTEVEKNRALTAGNIGCTKVDQENARFLESSVHDAGKETILQNGVIASKKLRPQGI